jgi:hypothetical protein
MDIRVISYNVGLMTHERQKELRMNERMKERLLTFIFFFGHD